MWYIYLTCHFRSVRNLQAKLKSQQQAQAQREEVKLINNQTVSKNLPKATLLTNSYSSLSQNYIILLNWIILYIHFQQTHWILSSLLLLLESFHLFCYYCFNNLACNTMSYSTIIEFPLPLLGNECNSGKNMLLCLIRLTN